MSLEELSCCGIREFDGLVTSPQSNVKEMIKNWLNEKENGSPYTFILFSDIHTTTRGINTAKYIKNNKLGSIKETRKKRNPNTGNILKIWIWAINEKTTRQWAKQNLPEKYARYKQIMRERSNRNLNQENYERDYLRDNPFN